MTMQWKDELESKFGLTFDIIDRERIHELRRLRGFSVNPWTTGSRFILSHSLLAEEDYVAGLRDVLGEFRSRALFILDEAHHAAPSGGARYAISSQLTRAVRELSACFEHRLFLPPRRTTGIPTASRRCSKCSIRSASRVASRRGRRISSR